MEYVKKIILNTGEEIEQDSNIKPSEFFTETYTDSNKIERKYINAFSYRQQFKTFEYKVLRKLNQDIVESYAVGEFDLIPEDEIDNKTEEKEINDFSDEEVSEQYFANLKMQLSLINKNHIDRFMKVISLANPNEIENFLQEQELKNKIV